MSARMPRPQAPLSLGIAGLDRLLPMHIHVDASGRILGVGHTFAKLRPGARLRGEQLFDLIEIRRPGGIDCAADLLTLDGALLHCQFRKPPRVALKGVVVQLAGGTGALLSLSLGISVIEAVRVYDLTSSDFAPSDPTVEMLYLVEAKALVFEESKKLNQRLQGAKIAAEEQASTDTLTGLKNRRALEHVMARLAASKRHERFGLMHLDLDYFKAVNDTFGHAAGDHVLQEVARIMVEETRKADIVARIGGDEFVLLLRNCDDVRLLEGIARRIIVRLERPIIFEGRACRVSASIGITVSSHYATLDMARLSADADQALYTSKAEGRGRHTTFVPGGGRGKAGGGSGLPRADRPM